MRISMTLHAYPVTTIAFISSQNSATNYNRISGHRHHHHHHHVWFTECWRRVCFRRCLETTLKVPYMWVKTSSSRLLYMPAKTSPPPYNFKDSSQSEKAEKRLTMATMDAVMEMEMALDTICTFWSVEHMWWTWPRIKFALMVRRLCCYRSMWELRTALWSLRQTWDICTKPYTEFLSLMDVNQSNAHHHYLICDRNWGQSPRQKERQRSWNS